MKTKQLQNLYICLSLNIIDPTEFSAPEFYGMEDYKKLLTDLYTINDPERIKQIDYFLERYKGEEEQFYISQKAKYTSKKPVSDSKKIIEEALARIKAQSTEKPKEDKIEETKAVKETLAQQPKKETPAQKTTKDYVWFEEKPKKAIPPAKPTQSDPNPFKTDKHFNKKYFLYIFGSVLLVIILVVIVFFIFFYSPTKKEETTDKPKTTITKKPVKAEPKTTAKPTEKKETSQTAKPTEKKETTQTAKPQAKTSPKKQTNTNLSGVYIKKGDINFPAYFIACSAVKNERIALQKVSELKTHGFDASYYWIPDFVELGNPYFKVVIGPFSTRIDAMRKLTPVQERAEFDAYVLVLK